MHQNAHHANYHAWSSPTTYPTMASRHTPSVRAAQLPMRRCCDLGDCSLPAEPFNAPDCKTSSTLCLHMRLSPSQQFRAMVQSLPRPRDAPRPASMAMDLQQTLFEQRPLHDLEEIAGEGTIPRQPSRMHRATASTVVQRMQT